ncbi:MAG: threonine ammonia-lyase [Acidimicrobiales bacterium]
MLQSSLAIGFDDVLAAARAIEADVVRTPSAHSATLSTMVDADVWIKFENLQFTGSFKDRGSANHLHLLTPQQRARGVITLSAGNHAQGVAHHAARLGIEATVVMANTAPFSKVVATEALGARVVQHGRSFHEAAAKLDELMATHQLHYVPPYDDPAIMAGQGTVAVEMLADIPNLDVLVVPVGGGGLLAGMATAAKALKPSIEVIGVQIDRFDPVAAARDGRPEPAADVDTLADGIAVKNPGRLTVPIIDALADDVVVVSEEATERAIGLLLEIEKTVAEGAGAVALAAVMEGAPRFAGRRVGLVLSGGNIDSRVLASVLMRGLARSGRVAAMRILLQDLPGELARVVDAIAGAGANIIEIDHRRLFDPISARSTNVDVVVEIRNPAHGDLVMAAIRDIGLDVLRLSDRA